MKSETKATLVFLLAVPLLLGAVASKQRGIKNDVVPNTDALNATVEAQSQPMPVMQQYSPEPNMERVAAPTVDPASVASTYAIDWYSINGGGTTNASSTNYQMGASIGQSVAGSANSPSYQMGIGFWYGAGGGGGCACDCHGNPVCDAAICDVLDVVSAVNVAFRNGAALLDPNANCPYERTDVDCSTFTDVIDVVKIVTVAFRNGNPATDFCNPCP